MRNNKQFDNFLPILTSLLASYFLIRLIDFSKLITSFPVHVTGDIPSYMANLFFLSKYGFHEIVPQWFNGMILFLRYPPGWHYFTLPIYYLTKSITLATYLSTVIIFSLIFISLNKFCKAEGISSIKRAAFFLLMFGNGIAIGNFLRLGRIPELFGWLWFIVVSIIVLWYKDHKIDYKFLWIIPAYAALILSNVTLDIFFHSLLLIPMLFVIKKDTSEKAIVMLSTIAGLLISAFWWLPFFIDNINNKVLSNIPFGMRMLGLEDQPVINFLLNNLAVSAISIFLWMSFYVYWQYKKWSKRELLFFSPVLLLSMLLFFRVTFVLPVINVIYPDVHAIGYLFFALYFLFKTPLRNNAQKIFLLIISLFVVSNVIVSAVHTPWFPAYTQIEYNTFELLPLIEGKFIMLSSPYKTSYPHAYYSYAAVYYNVSTAYGMGTEGLFPSYQRPIQNINKFAEEKNCEGLRQETKSIQLTEIIAYGKLCDSLKDCGFEEVKTKEPACLYRVR